MIEFGMLHHLIVGRFCADVASARRIAINSLQMFQTVPALDHRPIECMLANRFAW